MDEGGSSLTVMESTFGARGTTMLSYDRTSDCGWISTDKPQTFDLIWCAWFVQSIHEDLVCGSIVTTADFCSLFVMIKNYKYIGTALHCTSFGKL